MPHPKTYRVGNRALKKLKVKSWKKGLKVVSLIQLIRSALGYSLSESKKIAEDILDGDLAEFTFATDAEKSRFKIESEQYGLVFDELT